MIFQHCLSYCGSATCYWSDEDWRQICHSDLGQQRNQKGFENSIQN